MVDRAIIFLVGGVAGFAAGYFFCRNKYEASINSEIDSIREEYARKYGVKKEEKKPIDKEEEKKKYQDKLYSLSYDQTERDGDEEWDRAIKESPEEPVMVPYYISPEAFSNEHNDFAKLTMVYYDENEVLLSEEEEEVDIDSTVGYDFVNHIGEYEKDACFVRNEALGNDYEILVEHASWGGD